MTIFPTCARPEGAEAFLITITGSIWCKILKEQDGMFHIRTWRRRMNGWSSGTRWVQTNRIEKMVQE